LIPGGSDRALQIVRVCVEIALQSDQQEDEPDDDDIDRADGFYDLVDPQTTAACNDRNTGSTIVT
jgi:hypothetical protein